MPSSLRNPRTGVRQKGSRPGTHRKVTGTRVTDLRARLHDICKKPGHLLWNCRSGRWLEEFSSSEDDFNANMQLLIKSEGVKDARSRP